MKGKKNCEGPSQSSQTARGNWSLLENTRLYHAWVRVFTDPITGSDQKKNSFWGRVFDDFKAQHGDDECIRRNQKACDLRMQHIKTDLKKWSAASKRVLDCPRSEQNLHGIVQNAHAFYRGQHNKPFKLEYCWDILNKCQTFMRFMVSLSPFESGSYATPPRRLSHSNTIVEETNLGGVDAQGGDEFRKTPLHEGTNLSARSNTDILVFDVADEQQSPPVHAPPPGRKAAKRAKRQTSMEAQSSLQERVAKSLEDMTTSNNMGWNKATELHEMELRATMRNKDIVAIKKRIAIEKELTTIEKIMLDSDPTALGSAAERSQKFAERQKKLAELQAQADALMTVHIEFGGDSATGGGHLMRSQADELTSEIGYAVRNMAV